MAKTRLSAERQLDRVIAEALGYKVAEIDKTFDDAELCYGLFSPNGEFIEGSDFCHWKEHKNIEEDSEYIHKLTLDSTWKLALEDEDTDPIFIPRYSTDVNAALSLIDGWFTLERRGFTEDNNVIWEAAVNTVKFDYEATAPTPALAICRAWLAWKQAQQDELIP